VISHQSGAVSNHALLQAWENIMLIGVPKEIKNHEYRVGLIPSSAAELVRHGHSVMIEKGAGLGSGIADVEYEKAGATIVGGADDVWSKAEMVIKVKEPLANERQKLSKGQLLFTYLHLAPDADQTHDLVKSGATCIAYETVTAANGSLPLLTPMSEVAGRLAPQVGAAALQKAAGGRGVLLGGVPGVAPGEVVILGGGVSGSHAAYIALGMGANVTVVDRSLDVLRRITAQFNGTVRTIMSTQANVEALVRDADLLIGCVLIPGAAAPKLITRAMLKTMKPGSVIVDVAIDQGGCAETSKATTHAEPTYVVDDVVHYCVANMPGAVARTSTFALNNATLPFSIALADKGWKKAIADDVHLRNGLNVHDGKITCQPVAEAHGLAYVAAESLI
jgi:alanine dehydrogenase